MSWNGILSKEKETISKKDLEKKEGKKKNKSCDSLPLFRCDLLATALHNARKHILISKPPLLPVSFTVPVLYPHSWVNSFLSVLDTKLY